MEIQKIAFDNLGLSAENNKVLALKWIEESIRMLKVEHLSEWVGDHRVDTSHYQKKLKELETARESLKTFSKSSSQLEISFLLEKPQEVLKKAV
ncbi:MAG: hypothetical protein ACON42_04360 [Flavobacteriaceae bacterium]